MSQAASLNPLGIEDKIAYTWEIERFSTLSTRKRSDDFYKTKDGCFILDLILCPPEAHMNVILSYYSAILVIRTNVHCPNSLNVHYTLSLLNKTGQKCDTQEGFATFVDQKMKANWVYPIFLDYVTANGFLVDDILNLHCEVSILKNFPFKTSPIESIENKSSTILNDYESLFKTKKYSDVTLVSGAEDGASSGKEFAAHKLILSTRSPVFAAMFEHECQERKTNRVEITDLDADTLNELLRYMYTDKVSSPDQYTAELLIAADKYQLDGLKRICEEALSLNGLVNVGAALELFRISDMHRAEHLKLNCLDYITENCTEVKSDQWKALNRTEPTDSEEAELSYVLFHHLASKYKN